MLQCQQIPNWKLPLKGKTILLKNYASEHAEYISRCYRDTAFMTHYCVTLPKEVSLEQVRNNIQQQENIDPVSLRHIDWVIYKQENHRQIPIGLAALTDYHATHSRAEILVGLLKPEHRVGSLGLEASLLVMEFAYHQAKLNKLISLVYGDNLHAQQSTLHLGFKQEGFLNQHVFNNASQQYLDLYQNHLMADEFFANKNIRRWSIRLLGHDITRKPSNIKNLSKQQRDEAKQLLLSHLKS